MGFFRGLGELRHRYRQHPLPSSLHGLARAVWKISAKPLLKIGEYFLARVQGFGFPPGSGWARDMWKLDMLLGLYEQDTVALCTRIISPGMTVLDVGAHIGYFTRLFAKMVGAQGKVYAFEPHPENVRLLRGNVSPFSNVVILNKAVSDKKGIGNLFVSPSTKSSSHSLFRQQHTITSARIEVVTLDEFWEEIGRPQIDLIKMDIEGAEPNALKGARGLFCQHEHIILITEFCPANLRSGGIEPEEVLELLSDLGFRYSVIGPHGNVFSELPRLGGDEYVNLFCEKS